MKTIFLASAIWMLTGCANMTPGEQATLDDLGAIAEGAAIVGAIVLDADEPPLRTDEHRNWCESHVDREHCGDQFEVHHK